MLFLYTNMGSSLKIAFFQLFCSFDFSIQWRANKCLVITSDWVVYCCHNRMICQLNLSYCPHSWKILSFSLKHRRLLLQLDTQARSHLVVEFYIQQGICTAPHPLRYGSPPPPSLSYIFPQIDRFSTNTSR